MNFAIFLDVESGTENNLSIVRVFIFTLLTCILLKMSKQLCTSYLNGDGRHNTMKTENNYIVSIHLWCTKYGSPHTHTCFYFYITR